MSMSVDPHILREYSLLADGERGAVVGPRGDIGWLCVPRWDSPSVFSGLIGGSSTYMVSPDEPFVWGGSYEEGSMIWRSRWVTRRGIVECREALAYPADPHRAVLLRPRGDYDDAELSDLHRNGDTWTARTGTLYLRWSGARDARPREHRGQLELHLDLEAHQQHDLVLELSDEPLPTEQVDASEAWRATETRWRDAVPSFDNALNPRDTRRSYAVLRGLTCAGGGMVAAATTSLPERAEAGRNYDYRYVWIRDQCYAGEAFAAAGADSLLDDAVNFVTDRLLEHGPHMAPAYTITGDPVPDQRHLGLPGYPGGSDIVGNWVNKQFQLDAFGEALLLFAAAARRDRLDGRHWDAAQVAAAVIKARWNEPDAGIWELEPQPWTHSRLISSAGLRAAAAAPMAADDAGDWLALADHILADTAKHALHANGYWQRTPDDPKLDASLMLPALRGALAQDDPRSVATLEAYLRELTRDGYAYRFRHDERPLPDAEGAFVLCGFLVALSHHSRGELVAARSWYEATRAATGPPQLFSEEYDAVQHQMRGNLPQAFVHALHIETAVRLARD